MKGPRITQKRLLRVLPQSITSDGNNKGRIVVPNSKLFVVGQTVELKDDMGNEEGYQIKRIVDKFIYLGAEGKGITDRSDVTQWKKANSPTIQATEQERPKTPVDQTDFFEHADEPILAKRTIGVDLCGEYVDPREYDAGTQQDGTLPGGLPAERVPQAPPFGYQYIDQIVDRFLEGVTYNQVENTVENDLEILTFKQGNNVVKTIEIRYNGVSWIVNDPSGNQLDGFILQEDGDFLLTEDGGKLFVLA